MATELTPVRSSAQKVKIPQTYENVAWKWMRYSGVLLIPLAWFHVILQDVIVGVHRIDINYVAMRWANIGWRAYTAALLGFAFAHGMNGFRQVLMDYIKGSQARQVVSWVLLLIWLVVTAIGAIAIIGGVR